MESWPRSWSLRPVREIWHLSLVFLAKDTKQPLRSSDRHRTAVNVITTVLVSVRVCVFESVLSIVYAGTLGPPCLVRGLLKGVMSNKGSTHKWPQ